MMFKIAFRGIFRNTRRSVTTMLTIAIGTAAMLIFGAYTIYVTYGLQTNTVTRTGHLTVYRKGYFDFGSGNPAIWGIPDYRSLLRTIKEDAVLAPLIAVATPVQSLAGIAGNFDAGESRTFFGTGFVPSDHDRMRSWNEYDLGAQNVRTSGLSDSEPEDGIIGAGLARILGLCEKLQLGTCPKLPDSASNETPSSVKDLPKQDFSALADGGRPSAKVAAPPHIDLLAATAGGAPNVVSMDVRRVESQGVRELDDAYVGMNLALAQQLVYGRGEHRVTGIVLQLHRTEDMGKARARLEQIFGAHHLALEVRDFSELTPFYSQALNLFRSIFSFISIIIGVVVLFTITNAMGMSVVERTDEIGTTRALGVRRAGIRRQFVMEGAILGALGATVGLIIALAAAWSINHAGLTWTPPGQAQPVPLRVYLFGAWGFIATIWLVLVVVATLAALFPANRAAKLQIVDALRHV